MFEYNSRFLASSKAEHVLRAGRIIDDAESPAMMVNRVVNTLAKQEERFYKGGEYTPLHFMEDLGGAMDKSEVVMSTPIMTNAGRYLERPLTACTVPTIDLANFNKGDLQREIEMLHEQGMGTGFSLNDVDDPVEMLRMLNAIAVAGAKGGKEDRPVGNMAVLSVYHSRIFDFIEAKVKAAEKNEDWKFNISVDIDQSFFKKLNNDDLVTLANRRKVPAAKIFFAICEAATVCADPGLVFLDRMNIRNPLPGMGNYRTTAPCAEVGLIEGETCQFGYINIGRFVRRIERVPVIDFPHLERIVRMMTRALDNAIELSAANLVGIRRQYVALQKRKIGIGLCGVADMLTLAGLSYDSSAARELMQEVLALVNFVSKEESIRLAEERGPCGAMKHTRGNRHYANPSLLESLYGEYTTKTVASGDWKSLGKKIAQTGVLRNISTIALPPTGRSALVVDASTGIEPHFDISTANRAVQRAIRGEVAAQPDKGRSHTLLSGGEDGGDRRPGAINSQLTANAHDIEPMGHLAMAAALQRYTDESISKTINLPRSTTVSQVGHVYRKAHASGMSGVTVYVDGVHSRQPVTIK